jgi:hypothetical protein
LRYPASSAGKMQGNTLIRIYRINVLPALLIGAKKSAGDLTWLVKGGD